MLLSALIVLVTVWTGASPLSVIHGTSNGKCTAESPFNMTSGEEIVLESDGYVTNHAYMDCRLPFQAASGHGICVTFDEVTIDDCQVFLVFYKGRAKNKEKIWTEYGCKNFYTIPSQLCTPDQFISVRFLKESSIPDTGYSFRLKFQEQDPPTSPMRTSPYKSCCLGILGPIIFGIIILVGLLLIFSIFIYCCCPLAPVSAATTPFASRTKPNYESRTLPSAWQR